MMWQNASIFTTDGTHRAARPSPDGRNSRVKIDAFSHIMPRPYYDRFFTLEETVHAANLRKRVANIPCLVDMDVRFAQMDEFGDYRQLINICAPPVEDLGSPGISRQMARIGNEALAEL